MEALIVAGSVLVYVAGWLWSARRRFGVARLRQQQQGSVCARHDEWGCRRCSKSRDPWKPLNDNSLVLLALFRALWWPVVLPFGALAWVVMHDPPLSEGEVAARRERAQRELEELEREAGLRDRNP